MTFNFVSCGWKYTLKNNTYLSEISYCSTLVWCKSRIIKMREPILRIIFGIFAYLFCHLTNGINVTDDGSFRIVVTEGGLVRGKKMTTIFDAVPYYSFRGIPYAQPPLKELRFKVYYSFHISNKSLNFRPGSKISIEKRFLN